MLIVFRCFFFYWWRVRTCSSFLSSLRIAEALAPFDLDAPGVFPMDEQFEPALLGKELLRVGVKGFAPKELRQKNRAEVVGENRANAKNRWKKNLRSCFALRNHIFGFCSPVKKELFRVTYRPNNRPIFCVRQSLRGSSKPYETAFCSLPRNVKPFSGK